MTEQQQHLQSVIQQSQTIVGEINKLNEEVASKRAMLTKLQGVAEYLDQIGVKLPAEVKKKQQKHLLKKHPQRLSQKENK